MLANIQLSYIKEELSFIFSFLPIWLSLEHRTLLSANARAFAIEVGESANWGKYIYVYG